MGSNSEVVGKGKKSETWVVGKREEQGVVS